jgi:Sigma-70, region 4.
MKPHSHEEHKRHTFDSFCKKVLKNEARDYYDEVKRRREHEISFSELSAQDMEMLFVLDDYSTDYFNFSVLGYDIAVQSELLAKAIAVLPKEKRDIILLSYFLDMTDREIGIMLNLVRSSVQYKRTSSLRELKKFMGGKADE